MRKKNLNTKQIIVIFLLFFQITSFCTSGAAQSFENESESVHNGALKKALSLYDQGDLVAAASALFNLRNRSEVRIYRGLIYLHLGEIFLQLKMPQIAAWQFTNVLVTNDEQYNKKALQLLALAADQLGDDTILNFAMSKIKLSDFPSTEKDVLYYRLGEVKFRNKDYHGAIKSFEHVGSDSAYGDQAKYMEATSYAMLNDVGPAISRFEGLLANNKKEGVTDDARVSALMGLARAYYQKGSWDKSLSYYRRIPRDHQLWHQMLFESSWANLRSGRFRSALGNFQSLHSTFYDDFYVPESLVLRGIVYLYICKYEEVEKVVALYSKSYGNVQSSISNFLRSTNDPMGFYDEIENGLVNLKSVQLNKPISEGRLPYRVVRHLIRKPEVERGLEYLRKLYYEKARIERMSQAFQESPIGKYSIRLLSGRIKSSQKLLGVKAKIQLSDMKRELKDLQEQMGYLEYELIGLKKDQLKQKMAGTNKTTKDVDDETSRNEYVKNGYEYWPFKGEYWLDEIGNYFYLGTQSCKIGAF